MLWNAGEKRHACVVLNRQVTCFVWDKNNKSKEAYYTADGITEKLNLYDFKDLPALITFIRTNISHVNKDKLFNFNENQEMPVFYSMSGLIT